MSTTTFYCRVQHANMEPFSNRFAVRSTTEIDLYQPLFHQLETLLQADYTTTPQFLQSCPRPQTRWTEEYSCVSGGSSRTGLMVAVMKAGNFRDYALIILLPHTWHRVREICQLRPVQVKLGKWKAFLKIFGERDAYLKVPLSVTVCMVLQEYLPTLPANIVFLFISSKTKKVLSDHALGYLLKKDAQVAKLRNVSS